LRKDDLHSIEVFPRKSDNSDGCWRWGADTAKQRLKSLKGRSVGNEGKWDVFEKDYLESDGELRRIKPKSVFSGTGYSTDRATKEFRALLKEADFSSPKSVSMLSDLIEYAVPPDSDEIILDFFSGSASCAHSTLQVNSESNGNRKFIMVQLPESTEEGSKNWNNGFFNICEIGKERIRRAAKKIKEEKNADIDYGFRVYRLDSSNMQDVYYKPQDYHQSNLDLFGDNVKPERTEDDLLAQVMLDWGLPLSLKIEQVEVSGKKVFKVAENSLYACFDNGIDEDFAKAIAKDEPLRIVYKDSGFKNDTAKTNVKQLLKQLSPETEMKVL
jgi:adenine-specific DNA-methyltransferase